MHRCRRLRSACGKLPHGRCRGRDGARSRNRSGDAVLTSDRSDVQQLATAQRQPNSTDRHMATCELSVEGRSRPMNVTRFLGHLITRETV